MASLRGPTHRREGQPGPPTRRAAPPPRATPLGKPLHSTERTTHVTVHYRWHPLYGQMARVNRSVPHDGGAWLFCELPDGTRGTLPSWMTDADACAVFTLGAPRVAIAALQELRVVLDALVRGSDLPEVSLSSKEGGDASNETVDTDPPDAAISANRGRARPPGRPDRSPATGADPRVGRTPAARGGRRRHRGSDGRA